MRLLDSMDLCTPEPVASVKPATRVSFPRSPQKRKALGQDSYDLDDAALRKRPHNSSRSDGEGSPRARGEMSSSDTRGSVGASENIEISDDEVGTSEVIEISDGEV